MKKQKKRAAIAFLILLGMGLAGVAWAAQEPSMQGQEFSLRPKIAEYKAENLSDPFKEAIKTAVAVVEAKVEAKPLPNLAIQGIVWESSLPQAIVNNKVVKKGDTIEEARVIDINKNGLTLNFQGQEYNLPSPTMVNLKNFQKKPEGGSDEK